MTATPTPQAPPQAAPPKVWHLYRAMVGVGLLCGILIVTVFASTRPVIERNRAEALERAIFGLLPDSRSRATFRARPDGFEPVDVAAPGDELVHAGYDEANRLVGVALEARGMGYQDVIDVLYAYAPERDAVVGLRILESRETPGLGDRIETDAAFLANFEALDVSLGEDGSLAHPIAFVKSGQKQHAWQIDGITGATISSSAIAEILRRSTEVWVPRIRRHLDDLRRDE